MNRVETEQHAVQQLLPWYVNGTLEAEERRAVDLHLDECHDCREVLAELRLMAVAIENDQPTPLIPEAPVDAFMNRAFSEPVPEEKTTRLPMVAIAASLLGLIAVSIWFVAAPPDRDIFRTVTDAPGSAAVSYVFELDIEQGQGQSVRRELATTVGDVDVFATDRGYRVIVERPSATMQELDDFAASMRQIDGVQRVDVIGVQLPID